MGRPKKETPKVRITVNLEQKDLDDLERIAKKSKMSRGRLARNLLLLGLDEARGMERVGIIGLIGFSRTAIDTIKGTFSRKKLEQFEGKEEKETEE